MRRNIVQAMQKSELWIGPTRAAEPQGLDKTLGTFLQWHIVLPGSLTGFLRSRINPSYYKPIISFTNPQSITSLISRELSPNKYTIDLGVNCNQITLFIHAIKYLYFIAWANPIKLVLTKDYFTKPDGWLYKLHELYFPVIKVIRLLVLQYTLNT